MRTQIPTQWIAKNSHLPPEVSHWGNNSTVASVTMLPLLLSPDRGRLVCTVAGRTEAQSPDHLPRPEPSLLLLVTKVSKQSFLFIS